jgi:predicted amidohydrolase YtcJ
MTHAIGDLAVNQVIRVSKKFRGRRLRVEHNELVIPEESEADEVDLVCSMQPNFLQWSAQGGLYERRLGPYILSANNHFRCLLERGVRLAFGSDSMPLDPVYGISLTLNPPHHKQKLSLQKAITCLAGFSCWLVTQPPLV